MSRFRIADRVNIRALALLANPRFCPSAPCVDECGGTRKAFNQPQVVLL
jgi:hypothetical protein